MSAIGARWSSWSWNTGTLLGLLMGRCGSLYDPAGHLEAARLYGNIDFYAYYFVDLLIGTPPQRVSVIVDTGSAVCAFPCRSCAHCGSHIDANFDFARSSTAQWQSCGAGCTSSCRSGHCSYYQGYTEGSSISGFWFRDYVRIGDTIQRNPAVTARIGCHNNENNLFYTQRANGILGLGPAEFGRNTLLQELFRDRSHVETSIFSMCLADWGGRMVVGGANQTYHKGVIQWLPLHRNTGYYHVDLTEIKIGGQLLARSSRRAMIDSGTTYTYMASYLYRALKSGIESHCRRNAGCGAVQTGHCFQVARDLSRFPAVTMVFGGVSTQWEARSYLYRKGNSHRWCYSFQDDGAGTETTLGASWMRHQDVIFDMVNYRVGIVPAACPEFRTRPTHNPGADLSLPQTSTTTTSTSTTTLATSTTLTTSTSTSTSTTTSTSTSTSVTTATSTTTSTSSTTSIATATSRTSPSPSLTSPSISTVTKATTRKSFTTPQGVGTTTTSSDIVTTMAPNTSVTIPAVPYDHWKLENTNATSDSKIERIKAWASDPSHRLAIGGLSALLLLFTGICCFCFCRWWRRKRVHKHVKLKETDEPGMPPVIVGSVGAPGTGIETFVIGEDEVDPEDESFEFVRDVEITAPPEFVSGRDTVVNNALRTTGHGSPRGLDGWDDEESELTRGSQEGLPTFSGSDTRGT